MRMAMSDATHSHFCCRAACWCSSVCDVMVAEAALTPLPRLPSMPATLTTSLAVARDRDAVSLLAPLALGKRRDRLCRAAEAKVVRRTVARRDMGREP